MSGQLELWGETDTIVVPKHRRGATIQERFDAFHRENPAVYAALVRMARRARAAGRKLGIKTLFETLRWTVEMQTTSSDGFKLNNDFTAYYARLIMAREADLSDFFETRRLRLRVAA